MSTSLMNAPAVQTIAIPETGDAIKDWNRFAVDFECESRPMTDEEINAAEAHLIGMRDYADYSAYVMGQIESALEEIEECRENRTMVPSVILDDDWDW